MHKQNNFNVCIKYFSVMCLLTILLSSVGCSKSTDPRHDVCDAELFSSIGERKTYQFIGSLERYTTVIEEVSETVGGFQVVRIRSTNNPPERGNYYGCQQDVGLVQVATDKWNLMDPSDNERVLLDPPQPLYPIKYGEEVGYSWAYIPNDVEEFWFDSVVYKVIVYEDITIPYGTFENSMKVSITNYEGIQVSNILVPSYDWLDPNIGWIKSQDIGSGEGVELVNISTN